MSCPLSSHWAAPTCTPDNTKGGSQAAGPLKRPTLPDTHQAPPRSPPPGSTRDRWSPAAGQASSQGEGRAPSPGPPSPLVRSRDDSCPSPHWMGRREASCPRDSLQEGRCLLRPRPLYPNPHGTSVPKALNAGERGRSSLALGGGWETSALTPGPSWAGGSTPCPGGLSSSALPSDRCRRETAVQRPASCAAAALGLAWLSVLGPFSPLRGAGGALSAPDPRSLSHRLPRGSHAGALSQEPAAGLEFGASPGLWAPCMCQGGAWGQLGVLSNMSQVLCPRVWA